MSEKVKRFHGVSARRVLLILAAVTAIISVSLLTATYSVYTGYSHMRENTDHYIQWQKNAYDLQTGSDYLTEQVRCYVETGDRIYLDNYFEEANVTRHRDNAVERVHTFMGETPAYSALVAAMGESVALMDREYYAMRLKLASRGEDVATYPEPIQAVALAEADAALPAEEQAALARSLVFDGYYREKKDAISANMQDCLSALEEEIDNQQIATADQLDSILSQQRWLIVVSIAATVVSLAVTLLLLVRPLLRAVSFIHEERAIPDGGSREFRILSGAYNQMFETNRQQKEELAYEATHDNLTGVYNRNGYDFIQRNVDWSTAALVLFDVDKFKPVNDAYGHKAGDRVLARVARIIQNAFRAQDYVCRIGGDEFAVIMVHTDVKASDLICKKVERINEQLAQVEDGIPSVHISCGAAYGAKIPNFDRLFHEADAALYRVKNSGGGGCEVCE